MIKLFVAQLEHQNVRLEGEEPSSSLDLGESSIYQPTGPWGYRLDARLVSGGILVSGKVWVEIEGICGRCLEEVTEKVENDDVCIFLEDTSMPEIDITEDVRSEMVIELPVNLLCSDDCAGLCHHCGINRNRESCNCQDDSVLADTDWLEEDGSSPWAELDKL